MWAVATRTCANQDMTLIHGAMGAILDPTSDPENHTLTKVGIDATKPAGKDFAERLIISDEQRARPRYPAKSTGQAIEVRVCSVRALRRLSSG